MKKLAISIAIAVALGLTGCGDSLDDIKNETEKEGTLTPASRVVFDPATSNVSVPNDLLFLGTTDGTLTLDSGETPDYTNPQTALGALDGWSTQNPFTIALSFVDGVELDKDSASQPGAVRLFQITSGQGVTTAADGSCEAKTRGHACEVVEELAFGQDFISAASGNNVAVIPLKPLKPASNYLLVLSSVLKDSTGNSIAPSSTYELLKQDFDTKPLSTEDQRSLQQLINSFEDAVVAEGVDQDTIIYTAAITTQSAGAVLTTLKQLMASPTPNGYQPAGFTVIDTGLTVADLGAPFDTNPAFALAKLYSGTVALPYYLGEPSAEVPTAPLSTRWQARCDSGVIIAALPDSMKPETPVSANDGFCQAASSGALRDLGVDASRHLTKFNTIPVINSYQAVDVQMTVPVGAEPAAGWPVVILQHGITSRKEDMLAVTGALSAQGFATVAIDHPLHGERGFPGMNASDGNPTVYMNLGNLLVTRDNLRQSIADMLALRISLNDIDDVPLDMDKVYVLGHSLGAIAGSAMVSLANTPTGSAELDALYQVKAATLGMPGGAIANFLLASPSFSPLIKSSLILGAGGEIAENYINFATANSGCGAAATPPFAACYDPFISYLEQNGQQAVVTQLNATFTQFAFAAQTVVDSGDPNNYAAALVASGTPVHILEVVGDGAANLPDQVIPNGYANPLAALAVQGMPLAGTEPLARLLQASAVGPAAAGPVPLSGNGIARFTEGAHASLLSPEASLAATVEMQTQAVSFFLTNGAAVSVADPSVLVPAN
ncbi:lipase [Chromatiaceae bacterium AAb-1]|nr:lipase [Chromatiaceae bacterium AAb-1]